MEPGRGRDPALGVAREQEPRFYGLLALLFATGMRRGEALALKWADVDFERGRISVRRSWPKGHLTTPKSGRGRAVAMPPGLAALLVDVLAARRREAMAAGWPDLPEWVFCSDAGSLLDERNVERVWYRVRRRSQKLGVRPLKLHTARHSYATLALASGKSLRWVADQLGHSSPMITLKTYAHVLREEEADLSFAEFEARGGSERLYASPTESGADDDAANPAKRLVELGGLEPPTLRLPA